MDKLELLRFHACEVIQNFLKEVIHSQCVRCKAHACIWMVYTWLQDPEARLAEQAVAVRKK